MIVKKIRILMVLLISGFATASYIPKEREEEVEQVFEKVFLWSKEKKPLFLEGSLASLSGWLRSHVSEENGLYRKKPLLVPVGYQELKRLSDLMLAVSGKSEHAMEKLIFERLDPIPVFELATALMYTWFFEVDNLNCTLGYELIDRLKEQISEKVLLLKIFLKT